MAVKKSPPYKLVQEMYHSYVKSQAKVPESKGLLEEVKRKIKK